jgi:hypothetical protein
MPVVNFFACLDLEQNILFLAGHYLNNSKKIRLIRVIYLLGNEAFEKCLFLFEFMEDEDFNRRNTLSISRIEI